MATRWTQEERDAFINAQNERYEREMKMFVPDEHEYEMELDGHYCDEGGHYHPEFAPDGRDLYDAHVERTMKPSLDEQMSSPEFRLATLEMWVSLWTKNLQKMANDIAAIQSKPRVYWSVPEGEVKVTNELQNIIEATEVAMSKRMDWLQNQIVRINHGITEYLYPSPIQPDDFDTQVQCEEMYEGYYEEDEKVFSEWEKEERPDKYDCMNCTLSNCDDCYYLDNFFSMPIYLEDEPQEELASDFWEERKETLIANNGTQFEMKIPEGIDW